MKTGDKCFFNIGNHRRMGVIVRINPKSVLVKMMIGARTHKNIKRHIVKHGVTYHGFIL